ncbi:DUF3034 family protein [Aquabacterium sp.]|uniref:DUF3034 family protein n=1 Tax=Aquabacterium sp. TaxID=1872578 RepID=UPI0025C03A35|nr:DUF3034 family protein [Aquabacterium sp.]
MKHLPFHGPIPQGVTRRVAGAVAPRSIGARVRSVSALAALALAALVPGPAQAGDRLLATWGVSSIDGAAGGGLTPWAVIAGTGSSDQVGGSAYVTHLQTDGGYDLKIAGAAVGIRDRLEFSMARWSFKLSDVVPGKALEMSVLGAKLRVAGDAVYDQDRLMPQVSVGVQHKQVDDEALVKALGARSASGTEVYVAATKLWLGAAGGLNVLGNATLRMTRANHFGLVGFGGPGGERWQPRLEASLGLMLRDDLVLGAEYRDTPNNLQTASPATAALREDAAYDVFLAWFPCRGASLTAAWVNLGQIVGKTNQQGLYLSGQLAF